VEHKKHGQRNAGKSRGVIPFQFFTKMQDGKTENTDNVITS
jgi:hypothetical protein